MIYNEKIPADALLLAMAIAAATSCAGGNPHIHIGKKTLKVE